MSREPNVPILLWVSTALLAHLATGGGADQLSRVLEEQTEIRTFARSVRDRLRPDTTFEVTFVADGPTEPHEEQRPDPPAAEHKEPAKAEKHADATPVPVPVPEKKPEKKPVALVLPKVQSDAPPPPPPPPPTDHRIAVRQHADPKQDDNPTAHFVADEANHVTEESLARITAHDQDDPNPTPGGQHSGAAGEVGNAEKTRIADSDEHQGDPTHAPGESGQEPSVDRSQHAAAVALQKEPTTNANPHEARAPGGVANPAHEVPAPPTPPQGGLGPASPEVVAQDQGTYRLDPSRPGVDGTGPKPAPGAGKGSLPPSGARINMLGLGGGTTPDGVNLNLTSQTVVAVVGQEQLTKERQADGERRRSAHRGSWQASGFERWRPAIENYVSSVKIGNTTALNTARVPFASYLNAIHNRIHPLFADDFLGSLEGLPANHPLNEPHLVTHLEIILNRDDGHVVRMGVVRTSGVTAFDIAALDSVQRASPFGKPPTAIVSPDGNVYFHWEFHRDPIYACSTMNARPYMLNTPPPSEEPSPSKPGRPPILPPGDPREGDQGNRQGWQLLPVPRERVEDEPLLPLTPGRRFIGLPS